MDTPRPETNMPVAIPVMLDTEVMTAELSAVVPVEVLTVSVPQLLETVIVCPEVLSAKLVKMRSMFGLESLQLV